MTQAQARPAKMRQVTRKRGSSGSNSSIRLVRTLHIYTSMLMLLIMLFFTVTGITLNHREWLPDAPPAEIQELELPTALQALDRWVESPMTQAEQVRSWLSSDYGLYGNQISYNWQEDEQLLLIDVKRPGGYSLVEVLPEEGVAVLENQAYGVTAVLNDLHMGRYSGSVWRAFIDISALLMLLFTLTGLWLVLPQKKKRQRLFALSAIGGGVMGAGYLLIVLN